ncbi:preprotein translocase subunit SecE [Mycobacterium sp. 1274756.6]|uniref:preprotein translocase subunit SecE n=1 Tax=Mycobacterium sp. 1274756.6 TaxID=1834076 RepID=UPI0007FECA6A|nr:preprotein translocase subunit SecE [Mycobacterium sp. 1274756.6]OBJ71038.1 preprotein translocase subunit SecE [Mycobacterium sp. 1274756.6]
MSDERDGADAADTGDAGGQSAVVTQPKRPSGKRQRIATETGAAKEPARAGADVGSATKKTKKAKKARTGPSRNPFLFVFNYLKQVVNELRKVIWPNKKQMITYTSVVLAFLVFMVALVALSDYGLAKLVMLVFGQNT